MYACMHAYMHTCMHVCMYACMHACMYTCIHVCMRACMHVYMYTCIHFTHQGGRKNTNVISLEYGRENSNCVPYRVASCDVTGRDIVEIANRLADAAGRWLYYKTQLKTRICMRRVVQKRDKSMKHTRFANKWWCFMCFAWSFQSVGAKNIERE